MDKPAIEFSCSPLHCLAVIYVLAYPVFEASCARRIADFRAKHERQRAELVPPHVTLVFGVVDEHLQAVAQLVETATSQTQEFNVSFDDYVIEFDPFEKKYKIFLLCGAGSSKMTTLHNQLYEGTHRAELSSAHPFRSHMTIATYERRADIEQVDISRIGELPINGELRALELVQLIDGKLTTLKTVPFLG